MEEQQPGPGWAKQTDSSYAVDEIAYKDFSGVQSVAGVFHVLAWLVVIGGVVAAATAYRHLHGDGSSSSDVAVVVGCILGGTVLTSAILAFFGYVLELLVAIHFDVRMPGAWKIATTRRAASKAHMPATDAGPMQTEELDGEG